MLESTSLTPTSIVAKAMPAQGLLARITVTLALLVGFGITTRANDGDKEGEQPITAEDRDHWSFRA